MCVAWSFFKKRIKTLLFNDSASMYVDNKTYKQGKVFWQLIVLRKILFKANVKKRKSMKRKQPFEFNSVINLQKENISSRNCFKLTLNFLKFSMYIQGFQNNKKSCVFCVFCFCQMSSNVDNIYDFQ